jgi:hypothetical protein
VLAGSPADFGKLIAEETEKWAKVIKTDLGGDVLARSPADYGKLIADQTEKWAKVIRAANIKPQ